MSTIHLRRNTLHPEEIAAHADADGVITMHTPAFALKLAGPEEYHALVEAGWTAIYRAAAHRAVLGGMLPGGAK